MQHHVHPRPRSVKPNIRTHGCGPGMWLSVLGRTHEDKSSSPGAEREPMAFQEKHKSSITSLREDPYPFLPKTCPKPWSAWPRPPTSPPFPEMPGLRQREMESSVPGSWDAESCLPPCCAVPREPFVHPWESWDPHTPAGLLAQNSQAHEGCRTSWAPWDQQPRHPLTNRHRCPPLASLRLLVFATEEHRRHVSIQIPPEPR